MNRQISNFAKNNTMLATIQYIRNELRGLYSGAETEGLIRIIFHHTRGYTLTDLVLNRDETLKTEEVLYIRKIVERLKQYEPIQYITGSTEFAGLRLLVNPSVLIPRPETEELVQWILTAEDRPLKAMDIGTGSGCIALSIKKNRPGWEISACDVSLPALQVAKDNATRNHLIIDFFQADILQWPTQEWSRKYDLIVSNPPYVTDSERSSMNQNVLNHEPHQALFVRDLHPLIFYESIARFAATALNPAGSLYFEINESYGSQLYQMLEKEGFLKIEVKKDIHGKDRMVRCETSHG
jgi:release factor glutamine methyltransferase